MTGPSTGSCGRRPKSAKARNRVRRGAGGAAGAMGIWPRGKAGGGWTDTVDAIALAESATVRVELDERGAYSTTRLVRLRADPTAGREGGRCRPMAGENVECHC